MSEKNSTQTAVVTDYVSEYNSATGPAKVAVVKRLTDAVMAAAMAGDTDTAQAYAKQHDAIKAMGNADKAPAVTRAMLLNRRVAEMQSALAVIRADEAYDRTAGHGDKWTVDEKRVTDLAKVRTTEKSETYRGATPDYVGKVAAAIGSGDFTVSAFIKAGVAAGVTNERNASPNGAVGAWMNKHRDETVRLGDVDVTITRNSDGVAILRVA